MLYLAGLFGIYIYIYIYIVCNGNDPDKHIIVHRLLQSHFHQVGSIFVNFQQTHREAV